MGGPSLFFQPGQCPFHEASGREHEIENISEPDFAGTELVSVERAGYGVYRILVLVAVLCGSGCAAARHQRRRDDWTLSAVVDRGVVRSFSCDQEDALQRNHSWSDYCRAGLRGGMDICSLHSGRRG